MSAGLLVAGLRQRASGGLQVETALVALLLALPSLRRLVGRLPPGPAHVLEVGAALGANVDLRPAPWVLALALGGWVASSPGLGQHRRAGRLALLAGSSPGLACLLTESHPVTLAVAIAGLTWLTAYAIHALPSTPGTLAAWAGATLLVGPLLVGSAGIPLTTRLLEDERYLDLWVVGLAAGFVAVAACGLPRLQTRRAHQLQGAAVGSGRG